jgi:molybdopterin synthase sulfur carrier subunit
MPTDAHTHQLAKVTVRLYTALRAIAGEDEVQVEAGTVNEVLQALVKKYGAEFKESLFDPQGKIDLRFYRIFINKEVLPPDDGLDRALKRGDVVQIFPPVVGG